MESQDNAEHDPDSTPSVSKRRIQAIHDTAARLGAECREGHVSFQRRAARFVKASPDDASHPGWPKGTPDGVGGQFKPKESPFLPLDQISPAAKEHPVPLVDDTGKPILGDNGKPLLRPANLDPAFFVSKGEEIRKELAIAALIGPAATGAIMGRVAAQLLEFRQGRSWDAQRVAGKNVREYQDYATIAIGLYAAAASIPIDQILTIQNEYAKRYSHYPEGTRMDDNYTHLPERNVRNTIFGYDLYDSGRIGR